MPSFNVSVAAAAAVSVTKGSMTSKYFLGISSQPGNDDSRESGMCECSGAHSESKPRSSRTSPSSAGPTE